MKTKPPDSAVGQLTFQHLLIWVHLPSKSVIFVGFSCCVRARSFQFCQTLSPVDCSSPGSSVHGTIQARTLEWVALPSSKGSSWPRDRTHVSHCKWILYCWVTRQNQIQWTEWLKPQKSVLSLCWRLKVTDQSVGKTFLPPKAAGRLRSRQFSQLLVVPWLAAARLLSLHCVLPVFLSPHMAFFSWGHQSYWIRGPPDFSVIAC